MEVVPGLSKAQGPNWTHKPWVLEEVRSHERQQAPTTSLNPARFNGNDSSPSDRIKLFHHRPNSKLSAREWRVKCVVRMGPGSELRALVETSSLVDLISASTIKVLSYLWLGGILLVCCLAMVDNRGDFRVSLTQDIRNPKARRRGHFPSDLGRCNSCPHTGVARDNRLHISNNIHKEKAIPPTQTQQQSSCIDMSDNVPPIASASLPGDNQGYQAPTARSVVEVAIPAARSPESSPFVLSPAANRAHPEDAETPRPLSDQGGPTARPNAPDVPGGPRTHPNPAAWNHTAPPTRHAGYPAPLPGFAHQFQQPGYPYPIGAYPDYRHFQGSPTSDHPTPYPMVPMYFPQREFPDPKKVGFKSNFKGKHFTEYLERFENACEEYHVVEFTSRVRKFKSWCDFDVGKQIDECVDLPTPTDTWPVLVVRLKRLFKIYDPRQDEDIHRELDDFYAKVIPEGVGELRKVVFDHSKLLSRVPTGEKEAVRARVASRFWMKFSESMRMTLINRGGSERRLRSMNFITWSDWINDVIEDGYDVGGRIYKEDKSTIAPSPAASDQAAEVLDQYMAVNAMVDREMALQHLRANIYGGFSAPGNGKSGIMRTRVQHLEDQAPYSLDFGIGPNGEMDSSFNTFPIVDTKTQFGRSGGQYRDSPPPPRRCFWCGKTGHYAKSTECPKKEYDEAWGLCHTEGGRVCIGKKEWPESEKAWLDQEDVRKAQREGKVGDLVRAAISLKPELNRAYEAYTKWAEHWEAREGKGYRPEVSLIRGREQTATQMARAMDVRLNRLHGYSKPYVPFNENSASDYITRNALQRCSAEKWSPRSILKRSDDAPVVVCNQEVEVGVGAQGAKRVRIEDLPKEDMDDPASAENPKVVLTPAQEKPKVVEEGVSSDQGDGVRSGSRLPDGEAEDSGDYIAEKAKKYACGQTKFTLEEHCRVSPTFAYRLMDYVKSVAEDAEVIEWRGSSKSTPDGKREVPQKGEALPSTVRTNFQTAGHSKTPPSDQRKTVPALYGITADGEYGVVEGGIWEKIIEGKVQPGDSPEERLRTLLSTPIGRLSGSERTLLGAVTRTHNVPSLYCNFVSPTSEKVLAMLDTGSECNLISRAVAERFCLPMVSTNLQSKGLHGDPVAFIGETQAPVVLAGVPILCHFFVIDNTEALGFHDLLLGIPFFTDTSLTLDFMKGCMISANMLYGGKLIKAHVVKKEVIDKMKAEYNGRDRGNASPAS